jgi:hypothetical protein
VAAFSLSMEDDMLQPGWYLPDTDWFAQFRDAPRLAGDGQAVIGQLAQMLRDEPAFGPATTVAATTRSCWPSSTSTTP